MELQIKEKVEKNGTRLEEWDISINRGILTGYNNAFIIDETTKNNLINEDPKSAEIIRPILRGRDIKRYGVEFQNIWLINTHNGLIDKGINPININEYPVVKKFLDRYLDNLIVRQDQGITPYNLRSCAYMDDFSKPKIMYSEIVQSPQFYLDEDGHYWAEATTFIMTGENLIPLVLMLNSDVTFYIFKKFYAGGALGDHGVRYKKAFLTSLPLPRPTKNDSEILNNYYKMITSNDVQLKTNGLVLVDQYLYKKYEFTEDEIDFIKRQK